MLNINKIQTALSGLVGFKNPYNPDYAIVDATNVLSESGYFVTDNSFAKIEYIKDNQDYLKISDVDFNKLLTDIKKSAISNVCNRVFSEYDFLDRNVMYKNASNKINTEGLPLGFVGYKIEVGAEKNIAFKINRVLLDFDGIGEIKLLLWNTAKKAVLLQKTIEITSDHQEVVLEWTIDNTLTTYKGDYYIGYNTTDITVVPFKRELGNSDVISTIKYLCFQKVFVSNHATEELFDINKIEGLSTATGLNFDISVFDDFTDFVINNKMLFAKAIQLDCIIQCLQIYMTSLRSNANQSNSNQMYEKIMIDLEGTSSESLVKVNGLRNQLLGEITTIKEEIKKMKVGFSKSRQFMVNTLQ
jgi:hypothetical protein